MNRLLQTEWFLPSLVGALVFLLLSWKDCFYGLINPAFCM